MDVAAARFLASPEGLRALDELATTPDPGALSVGTRLRTTFSPDQAAALTSQASLRRRARTKFGEQAEGLLFTADGLEQATRPDVARWRAARLASSGASRVVDLGCGLGADAIAFVAAGLEVVAVEQDEATAVLAAHNLGQPVLLGDAVDTADDLLRDSDTVFLDPARRGHRGRTWDPAQLTPPWTFVTAMLGREATVKLGPGLPHRMIPEDAEATWVSDGGDVVEVSLWTGPGAVPGRRAAVLLPDGLDVAAGPEVAPVLDRDPQVGDVLIEADGALIRAGALSTLAAQLGASRIDPQIAYLVGPDPAPPRLGASFRVLDVLAWREKDVRAWVRRHDIGTLEIKKRGIEIDPAELRRRLKPRGTGRATLIITPVYGGSATLVVERI